MARLWMFRSVLAGTLLVSIGSSLVSQEPKSANKVEPSSVLDVGSGKQLFIDERFITSSRGLVRRVNPPIKAGPVLLAETGVGYLQAYVSVLEDPTTPGRYLMYYLAAAGADQRLVFPAGGFHLCLAVSQDGIHWQRKRVGKYEIGGPRRSHVLPGRPSGMCS